MKKFYKIKSKIKILLNLAIINSELNEHELSLDLSKNAAVLGISLMKELFVIGDHFLQKQKKLHNWFYAGKKKLK